jgi:hypothetical protein
MIGDSLALEFLVSLLILSMTSPILLIAADFLVVLILTIGRFYEPVSGDGISLESSLLLFV